MLQHLKEPTNVRGHTLNDVIRREIVSSLGFFTLVNVYVDLVVFTRIAGTSKTGSRRYWC